MMHFLNECLLIEMQPEHKLPRYQDAVHCPKIKNSNPNQQRYGGNALQRVYSRQNLNVFWRPEANTRNQDYWGGQVTEAQKEMIPAGRTMAIGLVEIFQEGIALAETKGAVGLSREIMDVFVFLQYTHARRAELGITENNVANFNLEYLSHRPEINTNDIDTLKETLQNIATIVPEIFPDVVDSLVGFHIPSLILHLREYIDGYFVNNEQLFLKAYQLDSDDLEKMTEALHWVRNPENASYVVQAWRDLDFLKKNSSDSVSLLLDTIVGLDRSLSLLPAGSGPTPFQEFQLQWLKACGVGSKAVYFDDGVVPEPIPAQTAGHVARENNNNNNNNDSNVLSFSEGHLPFPPPPSNLNTTNNNNDIRNNN